MFSLNKVRELPDTPGVYLFYNNEQRLIYVGKATSLRSRVGSYFIGSAKNSRPIEQMIAEVTAIKHEATDSILEAIILEANLIKKHQPIYNVDGKDDKSWQYLCFTKDDYPMIKLVREHDFKKGVLDKKRFQKMFGPYSSGTNLTYALKILRRIFKYSTCKPQTGKPCLYRRMSQCLGVCTGEITAREYRRRVIAPLSLFLSGKKRQLLIAWGKNMQRAVKAERFEAAAAWRDQIKALQHLQDTALINKEFFVDNLARTQKVRIEGYDISHFSGQGIVGSLVVFNHLGPIKSAYRRFKIKSVKHSNDTASLAEVVSRRLKHLDWPLPNIFLVDGGVGQVNAVKKILGRSNIKIPVIGIAKGPERKRNDFIFGSTSVSLAKWVTDNEELLIQVRDEAHRFAIAYQKALR